MENTKLISIHNIIDLIIEKLSNNGEVIITVTGNSMFPFYIDKKTEVVLVKPDIFKKTDVVLYKGLNNTWVLHRIIKIKRDQLIICGDALRTLEYVNKNHVVGIVKEFKTNGNTIKSNNIAYQIKVKIWMSLRFLRRYLIAILRRVKKYNK